MRVYTARITGAIHGNPTSEEHDMNSINELCGGLGIVAGAVLAPLAAIIMVTDPAPYFGAAILAACSCALLLGAFLLSGEEG